MNEYLGEIGLILLGIFLLIMVVSLLVGMGISLLLGLTGLNFYGVTCIIAVIMFIFISLFAYN